MNTSNQNRLTFISGKAGAVIRTQELLTLVGISRMTLHRWVISGKFPQPLRANNRAFGFSYASVIDWMDKLEGKNIGIH
nr:AlpA family phage regulatory protein [uncultured Tolumonas sp.]